MKNFTSILTMGFVVAGFGFANADTDFVMSEQDFWTTHRTTSIMGDFTNNDLLDIFYGGQGNNLFNTPDWWWQIQQNFCINQGDGTFNIDGYSYETYEYEDEDTGETKIGYMPVSHNHGIRGTSFNQYAVIDYNNDGLLDLLLMGEYEWDIFLPEEEKNITNYLLLYKNIGDGKFELETNAVFPSMKQDNSSQLPNYAIAVGDYDRDGYVDIVVSATEVAKEDEYMPGRTVSLYKNMNGSGVFKDMKIANTKGGVYSNEVKDADTGTVIVEKKPLEGYFLPMSGNVHFADINNDGWLDIVTDGWADNNWDGIHEAGNTSKIYLNVNGEKFEDVTPDIPTFYSLRSSASSIADMDHDGYLDYFMTGWGDNGWQWNAFLFYNTADENNVFDEPYPCDQLGLDGTENCHQIIRDFDGDGYLDILYSGNVDCYVYYGNLMGSFTKGDTEISSRVIASAGDLTGNGLADLFFTGYKYFRAEDTWGPAAELHFNSGDAVESPEAPENVKASVEDGVLNISWDYNTDDATAQGLAYNIYVKKVDGSVFCLVPANPESGFVKVGYGRTVALRPEITSYSMSVDGEVAEVGVQAISLDNETYSPFTTVVVSESGVKSVIGDRKLNVVVNGDYINVNGVDGEVAVYDVAGKLIGKSNAGSPVYVAGKGVFIVKTSKGTAKVVK